MPNIKLKPLFDKLNEFVCDSLQVEPDHYFELLIASYLSRLPATLQVKVETPEYDYLPINTYSALIGPSGLGKSRSARLVEDIIYAPFFNKFKETYLPAKAQKSIRAYSQKLSREKDQPLESVEELIQREWHKVNMPMSFGLSTSAAIKQQAGIIQMIGIGCMNASVDEMGQSYTSMRETLTDFLSLYDQGKLKMKLLKGSDGSVQIFSSDGFSPANLLMYGTYKSIFDGGETEKYFLMDMEAGYARRLCFAYLPKPQGKGLNPEEELARYKKLKDEDLHNKFKKHFESLMQASKANSAITMPDEIKLKLIEYKHKCAEIANKSNNELIRIEANNRLIKVIKYAGTFSFLANLQEVSEEAADLAIRIVDNSAIAFKQLVEVKPNYARFVDYLVEANRPVSHAQLAENLNYYPTRFGERKDFITLAISNAYDRNIVISQKEKDGAEFIEASPVKVTDLDHITLSYSKHMTKGYKTVTTKYSDLRKLLLKSDYNFCVHGFLEGHRAGNNTNTPSNLAVFDVDGTENLQHVQKLLKDYYFITYTTKRHTDLQHRFRIILPLSHAVDLDPESYKKFMENILEWLPISVDTQTVDKGRKWACNNGSYFINEGEGLKFVDTHKFIPYTSRQEDYDRRINSKTDLTNLEKWFLDQASEGSRNNITLRYALTLKDKGYDYETIISKIDSFNANLTSPLSQEELHNTIFKTIKRKIA